MIIDVIDEQKKNQFINGVDWSNSKFKNINDLVANNVGNVGEIIINNICKNLNIESSIDGSKTKQIGGGYGDGKIKNRIVEVKTARLGNNNTFQHELGEHPWNAEFMCFVDVTPENIYLSIIPNFSKDHYDKQSRTAEPYFNKSITRRKEKSEENSGAFKLTINETDLKKSYHAIILNEKTPEEIKTFINSIIE
tara:strand:+ start:56 stop:637 length:582 start_codon:yes stop_codon:yes gene_type:complete